MSCSPLRDCVDAAAFKSQLEPVYTTLAQANTMDAAMSSMVHDMLEADLKMIQTSYAQLELSTKFIHTSDNHIVDPIKNGIPIEQT
ncbi:hypothetical protein O5D80_001723 [Batrachochytrium dendrobatidis]|nr:hypothetical protein O5D80_001723 [Batrachochytrium dendrobatidis]